MRIAIVNNRFRHSDIFEGLEKFGDFRKVLPYIKSKIE